MNPAKPPVDASNLIDGVSAAKRAEIAQGLGARLDQNLTPTDRLAAEQVAARLAEDAIETVRQALAISVRNSRFLPKDVGLKLAHDIEDVAAPFLQVTEIFSDAELCDIVRSARQESKSAIARRGDLSEAVASSLAEHGDARVAADLMQNASAEIPDHAYRCLLSRFDGDQELADCMARREKLSASVAAQLVSRVSGSLHELLSSRYGISVDFVNPVVEDSRMIALLDLVRRCDPQDIEDLTSQLYERRELDPNLLLMAVHEHRLDFFEHAIANLAQQSLEHTRRLLRQKEGKGIGELCKRAGVPAALHRDIEDAVRATIGTDA